VDRTIGERNLIAPRGILAQLVELTTYRSDCAPAHAPRSAIYALHLSHHVLASSARVAFFSRPSPSLLVAFFVLYSLSFSAFAQLSNKRLSLSTERMNANKQGEASWVPPGIAIRREAEGGAPGHL